MNTSLIYQKIYSPIMTKTIQRERNPFARSPTLDTVMMVEKVIEEHSGEYTKTQLWKSLPKKVMWQTFLVIIEYLSSINKIALDKEEHIAYIWNPNLAAKLRTRKEISL